MMAELVQEDPEELSRKSRILRKKSKKMFLDKPGQMKLLIVVDMLLTGLMLHPPRISISTSRCMIMSVPGDLSR